MNIFQWLRFKFTRKYFDGENDLEVKKSKIGKTITYTFMLGDKIHRKDGPAFILKHNRNCCLVYLQNDELHRLDGPACVKSRPNKASLNDHDYIIFRDAKFQFSGHEANDGDYCYRNTKFNPEELGFEMPIDTVEKDTYMKLTFT